MKKYLIGFLIFILICFGIYIFLDRINAPSRELTDKEKNKALEKVLGRDLVTTITQNPTNWVVHKSAQIIFSYPASAKVYTNDNANNMKNPNILDSFYFGLSDPKMYVLTQAEKTPNISSLSDYPGYSLRENSSEYIKENITVSGNDGVAFFKDDNNSVEKTAFFYKNGTLYTISVNGIDANEVNGIFNKFISGVSF